MLEKNKEKECCHMHEEHECCHEHMHEEHEKECCHEHEEKHCCHEHKEEGHHCHCHDEMNINQVKTQEESLKESIQEVTRIIIGVFFGFVGLLIAKFANDGTISTEYVTPGVNMYYYIGLLVILIGYIVLLLPTIKGAIAEIKEEHTISENFLITISCVGAFLIGSHFEGLMVAILYEIGELLQDRAVDKSRRSVADLMNIKPEYANIKVTKKNIDRIKEELNEQGITKEIKVGDIVQIHPDDVQIKDIIVVKEGEKIPLDGIVTSGRANLNMASLTGESALVQVSEKQAVLSGSINEDGLIEVEVTSDYEDSTVQKILDLVEKASEKKAKTETLVGKGVKIYTPVVCSIAVLIGVFLPLITSGAIDYQESIYRALIFMVTSCPCAIAISIPLSYFSGIGKASSCGILVKGSNYIDAMAQVKTIVFDKTGTLTKGSFGVKNIYTLKELDALKKKKEKITFDNKKLSKEKKQILEYAGLGEQNSNHPIAKSIVLEYEKHNFIKQRISSFEEHAGKGISYKINGKKIKVGNSDFVGYGKKNIPGTCIYVKEDENILGVIVLSDSIKEGTKEGILELNKMGIITKMFTGDNLDIAKNVAKELKINHVIANMLPQDKYNKMEELIKNRLENEKVAFVGDGINDSPVLALSDVGIGMGAIGSSSSIEASDIVIMTDNINKIPQIIKISRKTLSIVKQNLLFALIVKLSVLVLSGIGLLGMFAAVFADVGVTLICILNTLRILRKKVDR